MTISVHPLVAIPEVREGDNLAAMLSGALERSALSPLPTDIVCVAQKIVSKAEGRFVRIGSIVPGAEALRLAEMTGKDARFIEAVLDESTDVVRAAPNVLITRHRLGFVMANAGIDRSNIGSADNDQILLLPVDPDRSAHDLREALRDHFGSAPAVLITDSFGRPWRRGVVNVTIGAAGMATLVDLRGIVDRDGRALEMTEVALADMVAAAAALVSGEAAEGIPAALVRGVAFNAEQGLPASALVRSISEDLFR